MTIASNKGPTRRQSQREEPARRVRLNEKRYEVIDSWSSWCTRRAGSSRGSSLTLGKRRPPMNAINQRVNPRPFRVVLKALAYLMLAVGAIGCAVPLLAPMSIAAFGHSMTIIKVHSMVAPGGAFLLIGGLAVLFYASRPSQAHMEQLERADEEKE